MQARPGNRLARAGPGGVWDFGAHGGSEGGGFARTMMGMKVGEDEDDGGNEVTSGRLPP